MSKGLLEGAVIERVDYLCRVHADLALKCAKIAEQHNKLVEAVKELTRLAHAQSVVLRLMRILDEAERSTEPNAAEDTDVDSAADGPAA
jgi:hypothetical protein